MTLLAINDEYGNLYLTNVQFDDTITARHVELYEFIRLLIECCCRKYNIAVSEISSFFSQCVGGHV